jgi:hypothetical protein
MSFFHLHAHEAPPSRREEPDAKGRSLAHAILLLVTALLIWSVLSRPTQFFAPNDSAAQHCVYHGRAGASCAPDAHQEASEPRR